MYIHIAVQLYVQAYIHHAHALLWMIITFITNVFNLSVIRLLCVMIYQATNFILFLLISYDSYVYDLE